MALFFAFVNPGLFVAVHLLALSLHFCVVGLVPELRL
jgi:hypothetical protein